jgi:hypothetical protein
LELSLSLSLSPNFCNKPRISWSSPLSPDFCTRSTISWSSLPLSPQTDPESLGEISLALTHTLTTSFCNKLLAHKISRPLKSKHKRNPILIEIIPNNRGKRKKEKTRDGLKHRNLE